MLVQPLHKVCSCCSHCHAMPTYGLHVWKHKLWHAAARLREVGAVTVMSTFALPVGVDLKSLPATPVSQILHDLLERPAVES
jgi:hypothetical protein